MEREPTYSDAHDALELRVLEGPQAGASAPLAAGRPCVVAAGAEGDEADIVLRDAGTAPARVRIVASPGAALIEVLQGSIALGDRTLAIGETADWAMHAPLRVGACLVAWGHAAVAQWPRAASTAADAGDAPAAEAAPAPGATPPARSARPDGVQSLRKGRSGAWLVACGLAVAVVSAGALGLSQVIAPSRTATQGPSLAEALRGSPFAGLRVSWDTAGRPELTGRLATLAQRTELDAWLAARNFSPAVNVAVDEAVARDVAEVFRVNGVTVQVRMQAPGHVVAQASERNVDRLAGAEEVVRRDVRGLERLDVVNSVAPAPPPPPPPVPDDPGKRIASLVPGDPAYLVTADGARYFVGAMLPTGHRITAITNRSVRLERNGETTTLNL